MFEARRERPPIIQALPSPEGGLTGWPWTVAGQPVPKCREDGLGWPRISIITPSYNQGPFLEECIRSVLLQGYPNVEYIVVDGGSNDQSGEIIQKYAPWFTYWVSEKDRGQTHAINKGLAVATGEIVNWVNSDDFLTPGALGIVARAFSGYDMVAGGNVFFRQGRPNRPMLARGLSARELLRRDSGSDVQQLAMWVSRDKLHACGGIDEDMHHAFDPDFYIRYLHMFPRVKYVDDMLGWYRKHDNAKTIALKQNFIPERLRTIEKLRSDPRFATLREDWEYGRRKYEWWLRLADIVNDPHRSAFLRAIAVVRSTRADPRTRWDRVTRRAVRNLLIGREIRPFAAAV